MIPRLVIRSVRNASFRCIGKFAWNFGVKGLVSVERFKRRLKRGEYFPPFLYLSIINSCNLRCQGCWVDVEAERTQIDLETLNRTITRREKTWECFLWHSRWRAVHASGTDGSAPRASGLLLPDFHQRPVYHGQNRRGAPCDWQCYAAYFDRGPRNHQRPAAWKQAGAQSHACAVWMPVYARDF